MNKSKLPILVLAGFFLSAVCADNSFAGSSALFDSSGGAQTGLFSAGASMAHETGESNPDEKILPAETAGMEPAQAADIILRAEKLPGACRISGYQNRTQHDSNQYITINSPEAEWEMRFEAGKDRVQQVSVEQKTDGTKIVELEETYADFRKVLRIGLESDGKTIIFLEMTDFARKRSVFASPSGGYTIVKQPGYAKTRVFECRN